MLTLKKMLPEIISVILGKISRSHMVWPMTTELFSDGSFYKRINAINCEYVVRPQIAISEFLETIRKNVQYLEQNL